MAQGAICRGAESQGGLLTGKVTRKAKQRGRVIILDSLTKNQRNAQQGQLTQTPKSNAVFTLSAIKLIFAR